MQRLPRRHYLEIAGVSMQLFKTLQRRLQVPMLGMPLLPFVSKDTEPKSVEPFDANGYSTAEAIMLALATHLTEACSFSRDVAAQLVAGYWNVLPKAVRRAEAGEAIWFATLAWDFEDAPTAEENGDRSAWHWVEAGTFDEVIAEIREEQAIMADKGGAIPSIALVDLSLIVRKARERANSLSMDVGPFFPEADD